MSSNSTSKNTQPTSGLERTRNVDLGEGNPFRNASGAIITRGLFYEVAPWEQKHTVVYTLRDKEYKGFESLYRLYMDEEDVFEWNFANKYLESWSHWEQICECDWFKPYVERWRKELELKLRSQALAEVRATAANEDGNVGYQANKYLLEKRWNDTGRQGHSRGRPSKDEIKREATRIAENKKQVLKDFDRLKLN